MNPIQGTCDHCKQVKPLTLFTADAGKTMALCQECMKKQMGLPKTIMGRTFPVVRK